MLSSSVLTAKAPPAAPAPTTAAGNEATRRGARRRSGFGATFALLTPTLSRIFNTTPHPACRSDSPAEPSPRRRPPNARFAAATFGEAAQSDTGIKVRGGGAAHMV